MTKPNGWEQDIKEDLYAIGAKPIHFEMNNAGVRIINKIHQAILSAEERGREEVLNEVTHEINFFDAMCPCCDSNNRAVDEIVKKFSLPDQERLSNTKTDE